MRNVATTHNADVSKSILLDPAKFLASDAYSHLIAKDRDLQTLHPLARGLLLLARDHAPDTAILRDCLRAGLKGATLSGRTRVRRPACSGDSWEYTEKVRHTLVVSPGSTPIALHFEAVGHMQYPSARWSEFPAKSPTYDVPLWKLLSCAEKEGIIPSFSSHLHRWWSACCAATPLAYSEDSGTEIGGMEHRLVRIDTIPVDEISVETSYNHVEFNGVDPLATADSRWGEFCFLYAVGEHHAHLLGLARPVGTQWASSLQDVEEGDYNYGDPKIPFVYPPWTADGLNLEQTWIGEEKLIESYKSAPLWFDVLTLTIPGLITRRIRLDGETLAPVDLGILSRLLHFYRTAPETVESDTTQWRRIHDIDEQLRARGGSWDLTTHEIIFEKTIPVTYQGDCVKRKRRLGGHWLAEFVAETRPGSGTLALTVNTNIAELLGLMVANHFQVTALRWRDFTNVRERSWWGADEPRTTSVVCNEIRVTSPSGHVFTSAGMDSLGNADIDQAVRCNISSQCEPYSENQCCVRLDVDITAGEEELRGEFRIFTAGDFYRVMPEDILGPDEGTVFTWEIREQLEQAIREGERLLRKKPAGSAKLKTAKAESAPLAG